MTTEIFPSSLTSDSRPKASRMGHDVRVDDVRNRLQVAIVEAIGVPRIHHVDHAITLIVPVDGDIVIDPDRDRVSDAQSLASTRSNEESSVTESRTRNSWRAVPTSDASSGGAALLGPRGAGRPAAFACRRFANSLGPAAEVEPRRGRAPDRPRSRRSRRRHPRCPPEWNVVLQLVPQFRRTSVDQNDVELLVLVGTGIALRLVGRVDLGVAIVVLEAHGITGSSARRVVVRRQFAGIVGCGVVRHIGVVITPAATAGPGTEFLLGPGTTGEQEQRDQREGGSSSNHH